MADVLAVVQRSRGALDDSFSELLSAARSLAGEDGRTTAALIGHGVGALASELARGFDAVRVYDDERLDVPDGARDATLLAELIAREKPAVVLLPHTNVTIDLAPGLAARLSAPLLVDCTSLEWGLDCVVAERTVFGGKVHARVHASAHAGELVLATLRGGAFPPAELAAEARGTIHSEDVPADLPRRRRFVRTVEPEAGAVDISQAEVLVGVGRGIEDEENLEIVQSLADALGAEVCCSRPVVDKGWLPKGLQVGTSGVTVKPRLYVAVGISGSFQHVGGIKGSPFMVAINKDAGAPIFGVADIGVVGDLFDVVPALEAKIREAKD
jgi:electron transfer flavoprotein alpha subunit